MDCELGRMNRWMSSAGFMGKIMIKSGDGDGKLFCILFVCSYFFVFFSFLARLRLEDDYRFQPSWHSFSVDQRTYVCWSRYRLM